MNGWRKADRIAERATWAAVAVAAGIAVWALSFGDLSFRPLSDGEFWGWLNAIICLAALTALSCYGVYKAVFARCNLRD